MNLQLMNCHEFAVENCNEFAITLQSNVLSKQRIGHLVHRIINEYRPLSTSLLEYLRLSTISDESTASVEPPCRPRIGQFTTKYEWN